MAGGAGVIPRRHSGPGQPDHLNELSATAIARLVGGGEVSCEAVVGACLARIEEREATIHAWAHLDPEHALDQARRRDRLPAAQRGKLHGVPIAVKDIIDTVDMPTEMGSPIYRGHRPPGDASCVALVRAAGAVILGKTVTAEFAGMTPGATANPHDPARTPGGSSSGSAAAVADFHVPVAFGTQTGGSVLRPSAYCGIVGYKPTFGTFNLGGVRPAAESLDTLGLHGRSLDDVALLVAVLVGRAPAALAAPASPPAIGVCRTYLWDAAEPETVAAVEDAAARLAGAGAELREIVLPEVFAGLSEARETFNCYQRARLMAHEWNRHRDLISEPLQDTIRKGLEIPAADHIAALGMAEDCRRRLGAVFDGLDVLLAPCVDGEAPEGLDYTGNPRFQGLWTVLGVPTVSLPTHVGPSGLPVGIQLVGRAHEDDRLLAVAEWVMDRLAGDGRAAAEKEA